MTEGKFLGVNETKTFVSYAYSTVYTHVQVDCTYKSTPKIFTQTEEKMQDPRTSRPPFCRCYMDIYFVARNEASVRQFNRRSVSARSVLQSNQAATVCIRPSYRPDTVSLFYRPYHQTAVCIMIKLFHQTKRSLLVCRHPARPPDHLPVSYYLAYEAFSAFPSVVRSPVRSPGSCSTYRRPPPPPPVARAVRVSRRPPVRRYQVASQIPAETQLRSIVRCSQSRVDVSGGHVSTCFVMKMVTASSLKRICMKSAHRFLQPSVTVAINFFWF